jgi:CubicO group peptidase (beta-lactamase class C family)
MKTIRWVAAIVAVLAAVTAALSFAPAAPRLTGTAAGTGGADGTGDARLAAEVRAAIPDVEGYRGLAVASIDDGQVRFAGLGDAGGGRPVGPDTPFENGSVTKVFTGMLFADMVARGEVRPTDTLADLLPGRTFEDPAVADVTLEELASHRSGLPRLAPGLDGFVNRLRFNLGGADPYRGTDPAAVLDAAGTVRAGDGRGQVLYSNLGVSVLGQALAVRAGTPYPQLVRGRLFAPLGMAATGFRADGDPPAGAAIGSRASGLPVDPWSDPSYAPSGIGDWSTASDLAKLVAATMGGTAPGADAARPRFTEDETDRIGYGWFTTRYGDREITWHNGGTGGFSAWVGFVPAAGRGLVLLGNTDRNVDPIGIALLSGEPAGGGGGAPLLLIGVTLVLLLAAVPPLVTALTVEGGRWWPAPDRLRLVNGLASAAAGLVLAYVLGAWTAVPGLLWTVAFGSFVAALAATVLRWRSLPAVRGGQRALRVGSAALSVAVSLGAIGVVAVAAAG